jgi:hypothetical protein
VWFWRVLVTRWIFDVFWDLPLGAQDPEDMVIWRELADPRLDTGTILKDLRTGILQDTRLSNWKGYICYKAIKLERLQGYSAVNLKAMPLSLVALRGRRIYIGNRIIIG